MIAPGRAATLPPDDVAENLRQFNSKEGIPIRLRIHPFRLDIPDQAALAPFVRLHVEHARLQLLRGFDELLCLEGLQDVEQLPHQIETVRKVLRHFRGRVLLADEVGLGKTIEACLLLREFLLRGMAQRVLIIVPNPLVSQWQDELQSKFHLDFTVPPRSGAGDQAEFWTEHDRVLTSIHFAKSKRRAAWISQVHWDLVIVDEAHHCKNRKTLNWQLINSLQRRQMFLLTATPVQNNLLELYNLLTLLEPGHLRTEAEFKKQYIKRGNPRDPRNRERLRALLSEVMIRNTRSLVQINLPARHAQTIQAKPNATETLLHEQVNEFMRQQLGIIQHQDKQHEQNQSVELDEEPLDVEAGYLAMEPPAAQGFNRLQLNSLLIALGSHPLALAAALEKYEDRDASVSELIRTALSIQCSAKDTKLLELLLKSQGHKTLIFINTLRTLHHLQRLLEQAGIAYSTFSGEQNSEEKDAAVEELRTTVPVMICTDSGGEGRNLQFADTLINYDLPWNPMRIEQRIGRVHRIGQTQEVFIFNLCTAGTLEARILQLLNDKIRMFELVVGEVGSILGNLSEGEEFESIVLNLWLKAKNAHELDASFDELGDALLSAQEEYVKTKELDEALFGDDYE